jgi:hypothetical protein
MLFWDLFRQGFITLGLNDSNSEWPFFRLSHFGKKTLAAGQPYKFTDTTSYIAMVKRHARRPQLVVRRTRVGRGGAEKHLLRQILRGLALPHHPR